MASYLSDILTLARSTLSTCEPLWAWGDFADATEALEHIYLEGLPIPDDCYTAEQLAELRPFVLIFPSEDQTFSIVRDGASRGPKGSGILEMVFSRSVSGMGDATKPGELLAAATEFASNIAWTGDNDNKGLMDWGDTAGKLHVSNIDVVLVGRTPRTEVNSWGDAWDFMLRVSWGRK
jgi:hypothetical protein